MCTEKFIIYFQLYPDNIPPFILISLTPVFSKFLRETFDSSKLFTMDDFVKKKYFE